MRSSATLPMLCLAVVGEGLMRVEGGLFGSDMVEEFGTAYRPCCKGEEVEQ